MLYNLWQARHCRAPLQNPVNAVAFHIKQHETHYRRHALIKAVSQLQRGDKVLGERSATGDWHIILQHNVARNKVPPMLGAQQRLALKGSQNFHGDCFVSEGQHCTGSSAVKRSRKHSQAGQDGFVRVFQS